MGGILILCWCTCLHLHCLWTNNVRLYNSIRLVCLVKEKPYVNNVLVTMDDRGIAVLTWRRTGIDLRGEEEETGSIYHLFRVGVSEIRIPQWDYDCIPWKKLGFLLWFIYQVLCFATLCFFFLFRAIVFCTKKVTTVYWNVRYYRCRSFRLWRETFRCLREREREGIISSEMLT